MLFFPDCHVVGSDWFRRQSVLFTEKECRWVLLSSFQKIALTKFCFFEDSNKTSAVGKDCGKHQKINYEPIFLQRRTEFLSHDGKHVERNPIESDGEIFEKETAEKHCKSCMGRKRNRAFTRLPKAAHFQMVNEDGTPWIKCSLAGDCCEFPDCAEFKHRTSWGDSGFVSTFVLWILEHQKSETIEFYKMSLCTILYSLRNRNKHLKTYEMYNLTLENKAPLSDCSQEDAQQHSFVHTCIHKLYKRLCDAGLYQCRVHLKTVSPEGGDQNKETNTNLGECPVLTVTPVLRRKKEVMNVETVKTVSSCQRQLHARISVFNAFLEKLVLEIIPSR